MKLASFMLMSSVFAMPSSTSSDMPMPTGTTKSSGKTGGDIDILQFALILEHLENAFYRQGTEKFGQGDYTGFPLESKVIYQRFLEIANHEETHVTALNSTISGLGGNPVPPCEYEFNITDAKSFVATSRILETVGASAYLGQLPLVSGNDYKTAAGSIALVEARHSSFLNTLNKLSGFGNSFETPLGARSVVTLASPFIKSCPFELPIKPFNSLKLNKAMGSVGDELYFDKSNATYCSFQSGLSTVWTSVKDNSTCVVPEGVSGDVFVHLTSDNSTMLTNDTSSVVSGPTIVNVKMSEAMMKKMKNGEKYQQLNSSAMTLTLTSMCLFIALLSLLTTL